MPFFLTFSNDKTAIRFENIKFFIYSNQYAINIKIEQQ